MNTPTRYADDSVKGFILWSIVWGTVAVLVGILISLQLVWPQLNVAPYLPTVAFDRSIPMPEFSAGVSAVLSPCSFTSPSV